jgi:hypothetical protein
MRIIVDILKSFIDTFDDIDSQVRVNVTHEGLYANASGYQNAVVVQASIEKRKFMSYDDAVIGEYMIEIDSIKAILEDHIKHNIPVCNLYFFNRTLLISSIDYRCEVYLPNIGSLNKVKFPILNKHTVVFDAPYNNMLRAASICEKYDIVVFSWNDNIVSIEAGAQNKIEYRFDFYARNCIESGECIFSPDIFKDVIKNLSFFENITISLGVDYPMLITGRIVGHTTNCYIAPRIEKL